MDGYASHIAFAQWDLGKCATDPLFHIKVLFFDEASFTGEGIVNMRNTHTWTEENPHAIQHCAAQS